MWGFSAPRGARGGGGNWIDISYFENGVFTKVWRWIYFWSWGLRVEICIKKAGPFLTLPSLFYNLISFKPVADAFPSQMKKVPFPVGTTRQRRQEKLKELGIQSRPGLARRNLPGAWILSARYTLNMPSLLEWKSLLPHPLGFALRDP